ncbi:M16 family metallopeptidase [Oleiharenicola lentus]|uniref:M16 family metallopeptidase n=1 Tax=Oleiharenicola lentus TaxID=2508720 RepID=UPI003F67941A
MLKRSLTLLALALSVATLQAAPAVEGYTHVKSLGGIDEYTLNSNGLQVLLMPDRSAPVVTFMVTYRVGSRDEVTGTTGATHLLEHLMFKGSKNYNKANGQIIDRLLEKTGAQYNASTWLDRTNYYQTLGSEHLDMVIGMEADRMRNLILDDAERKPEMTVVRNEFERGENSPFQSLIKEMMAAAYQAHPYHHSTIGWRSDIEKVSIEKLQAFYNTYYWPDNSTVTVLGDFTPEQALGLVKKYYGAIPKSPTPIPQVYTEEPEQTGPRRVTIKRAGQLGVAAIGYKSIGGLHDDFATLNVLGNILGDGQNSRLYRALTDKSLTTSVSPYNGYFKDPTLFIIFAALAPGATHEQVEKIIIEEIEKIKKDGVTQQETDAAVAKLLTDVAFSRDGSFSIAGIINEDIAVGDWQNYVQLPEKYKKVTPAMVQAVVAKYFNENQSTTGWFVPIVPGAPKPPAPATAKPAEAAASK